MHRRNTDKILITGTHAELLADPTVYTANFELSPTDTADAGKHKLCDNIHTYAQLSFIEDAGGGGAPSGPAGGSLNGTYPNPGIADEAVTNVQLELMPTGTVKSKLTPGTGPPENNLVGDLATAMGLPAPSTANALLGTNAAGNSFEEKTAAQGRLALELPRIKTYDAQGSSAGVITIDASLDFTVVDNIAVGCIGNGIKFMLGKFDPSLPSAITCEVFDETGAPVGDSNSWQVTLFGTP